MQIIKTESLDPSSLSADYNHWIYNGLDCCVTYEVFNNLYPMLDDQSSSIYNFSKELQAPVLEMVLRGILVNQNRRRRVVKEMKEKMTRLENNLFLILKEGIGVENFNWRSPDQVGKLFYNVMNLPVQKGRKQDGSYGPTTDRKALEKLQKYFIAEPIINHILALRDLGKSIGFLETSMDPDGRMRSELRIAGTVTGRLSSSISEYGTGTNLQNVTESLRSIFVADPGYKFCNVDLEQGDSRNVGALCWELFVDHPDWTEATAGSYLDACESGDLHTTVARLAIPNLPWGTAPDREIAETVFYRHYSYRFMCKKVGHGSNYLGKPPTIAAQTKLPIADIKTFQEKYFEAFPCIPAWHQNVRDEIENYHQLTNLFGRRRYFAGRASEEATIREAVAQQGQSMTSDEINRGLLQLWRANRVQLLMQVHDSVLFQYPEEMEDEIVPWALEVMKVKLNLKKGREFFVPLEAKVGWNWGEFSDDNPDGLIKYKGHDKRSRTEKDIKLSLASYA